MSGFAGVAPPDRTNREPSPARTRILDARFAMSSSPALRAHCRSIGSLGGLARAAAYDPHPIMANARAAFVSSFERQVRAAAPDLTDEVEIARRADALKRLHYGRMAFKSA